MPDGYARLKKGEIEPVFGKVFGERGKTYTVQASPAPSYTVYDKNDSTIASGTATDYDAAPVQNPRVWQNIDSGNAAYLVCEKYLIVFKYTTVGSDGLTRIHEPSTQLKILDPKE